MDPHPFHPDDLNDLEQRLAAWQPSTAGMDADRMLFAAGRASAAKAPSRLVWPAVSACLALVTVFLGARWTAERSERLALGEELRHRPTATVPAPTLGPAAVEPAVTEPPPADSYLAIRRRWERDPNSLLVMAAPKSKPSEGPLPANVPILHAWQRDGSLDP
jgi:hypothetical protein